MVSFSSTIKNSVLVIGTGQHVGKTTTCLGLVDTLIRRLRMSKASNRVLAYCKPVGQHYLTIKLDPLPSSTTNAPSQPQIRTIDVDKDTYLFKDFFHLPHDYQDMSPILFPRNFTRDYLDHKVTSTEMMEKLHIASERLRSQSDFIVYEGTGHTGVGSICNINNAQVAEALGLDVICVVEGGIGSSFDQLALNREMLLHYQVKLKGVVVNQVEPSKYKMVEEYYRKALKRWDIPLLGCVPKNPVLDLPSMADYSKLFDAPFLSGESMKLRYFHTIRLALSAVDSRNIFKPVLNQLVVTHSSRIDVLEAIITNQQIYRDKGTNLETGIIVTGWERPNEQIIKRLQHENIPCIYIPSSKMDSFHVVAKMCKFTAKLKRQDEARVNATINHINKYVNFDIIEL